MTRTRGQIQVEFLRELIAGGGTIVKANFSSQHGPMQHGAFHLTLVQSGVRSLHEAPWSPELEEFLLFERRLRMATPAEERDRFATILSHNLATAEVQYGEPFAQAVFVELLRERPEYELDQVLARVPIDSPSRTDEGYAPCRDFLAHSIDGVQNTAVLLGYPDGPESVRLVGAALERVLDDRFFVSRRE